jgi:peptidoglycan/LPS O-acetylase OafA/YrhL
MAAVAFACVALLWAVLRFGLAPLGELSWLVHPLLLGGALAAAVSARPAWSDAVLAPRPLAWAGRVSYSAYLYHMPLVLLMGKLLPGFGGWTALPAYLATLLALSWLSYRYVESPFLARRRADSP